jgi:hypothetical protein
MRRWVRVASLATQPKDSRAVARPVGDVIAALEDGSGMTTLAELANRYGSDKGTVHAEWHNYTALYDLLFARMRQQPITFLELGLARGGRRTRASRALRPRTRPR